MCIIQTLQIITISNTSPKQDKIKEMKNSTLQTDQDLKILLIKKQKKNLNILNYLLLFLALKYIYIWKIQMI